MSAIDSPPRRQHNGKRRPRRDEVLIQKASLVLPRIPPFLQPEPETLHQRAHDGLHLQHRERLPDAVHWPVREAEERGVIVHEPERVQVMVAGRRGLAVRARRRVSRRDEPALGPELGGEGEVPGVALDDPGREVDERARRESSAISRTIER